MLADPLFCLKLKFTFRAFQFCILIDLCFYSLVKGRAIVKPSQSPTFRGYHITVFMFGASGHTRGIAPGKVFL